MSVWCSFADEATFRAFHDQACADLGIPYAGYNAATGELQPDAQWTTAYVDPWIDHADNDTLKAQVRDEDVDRYGLRPCEPLTPVGPDSLFQPPEHPPWDWHQPLPDTKGG